MKEAMNTKILKQVVEEALKKLCDKDGELISSDVKEECINHKLAQYIEEYTNKLLPELTCVNVDVEYNKCKDGYQKMMGQKPIRPDILIHKRQSGNSDNYLAVEAKKKYSSKHDKDKIQFLVSAGELGYALGCVVSYQPSQDYIILQYLQSGTNRWEKQKYRKQPFEKAE